MIIIIEILQIFIVNFFWSVDLSISLSLSSLGSLQWSHQLKTCIHVDWSNLIRLYAQVLGTVSYEHTFFLYWCQLFFILSYILYFATLHNYLEYSCGQLFVLGGIKSLAWYKDAYLLMSTIFCLMGILWLFVLACCSSDEHHTSRFIHNLELALEYNLNKSRWTAACLLCDLFIREWCIMYNHHL